MGEKPNASGAAAFSPTILEEGDLEKLQIPTHCINEQATKIRVERLADAVGYLLTVDLNRGPMLRMWNGESKITGSADYLSLFFLLFSECEPVILNIVPSAIFVA